MSATRLDTGASAERGVVVACARRGPFGRLELASGVGVDTMRGGDEDEFMDKAESGRKGERATRSEAGDGASEVLTGAAGVLATKSVGDVDVLDVGDEGVWTRGKCAGRASRSRRVG